jgi:AcrR family transcriptional regulator
MIDKKTQIINAAIEVFAKQGLEKGKIADIAKQAGIGKGTVYEYFKSKDEIFSAIENIFIQDTIDQLHSIANSNTTPTKKIEEISRISLDLHEQMGESVIIISELWAQHSRGQLHGHSSSFFSEMYNDYYKIVSDIFKEGVARGEFRKMNIEGVTTMLLVMIDGVIWQSVIFKNSRTFNKRKKEAIKSFMNGIKK